MDLKNARILQELELNSRIPIKQLAKRVRLNEDTVHYRINKLQKDGIIRGFYGIIDYHKLGYITVRFMLKLQYVCDKDILEIIDKINAFEGVFYSLEVSGNYDIIFGIRGKTISQIYDIHSIILPIYQKHLHSEVMDILIEVGHYPRIFTDFYDRSSSCLKLSNTSQFEEVDELDIKILDCLANNARASAVDVAAKVDIPVRTCIYRLKNLEKKKIIQGYKLLLDYTKLGKSFHKLLIRVQDISILSRLIFFSSQNPAVTYYEKPLGHYNLEIDVEVKDELELRGFINSLKESFSEIQLIERISLDPYSKLVYY